MQSYRCSCCFSCQCQTLACWSCSLRQILLHIICWILYYKLLHIH